MKKALDMCRGKSVDSTLAEIKLLSLPKELFDELITRVKNEAEYQNK